MPVVILTGIVGLAALCTWIYEISRCIRNSRRRQQQPFEKIPIDEEDAAAFAIGHDDEDEKEEEGRHEESSNLLPK